MNENVENIVLEQLRLIRDDLRRVDKRLEDLEGKVEGGFDEVKGELHGNTMMIFGLSTVIGQIDKRVEHVEIKLGIKP